MKPHGRQVQHFTGKHSAFQCGCMLCEWESFRVRRCRVHWYPRHALLLPCKCKMYSCVLVSSGHFSSPNSKHLWRLCKHIKLNLQVVHIMIDLHEYLCVCEWLQRTGATRWHASITGAACACWNHNYSQRINRSDRWGQHTSTSTTHAPASSRRYDACWYSYNHTTNTHHEIETHANAMNWYISLQIYEYSGENDCEAASTRHLVNNHASSNGHASLNGHDSLNSEHRHFILKVNTLSWYLLIKECDIRRRWEMEYFLASYDAVYVLVMVLVCGGYGPATTAITVLSTISVFRQWDKSCLWTKSCEKRTETIASMKQRQYARFARARQSMRACPL